MDVASVANKAGDDQLKIVLHIEEGKKIWHKITWSFRMLNFLGIGFNSAELVLVSAVLSENRLDSDPIKPGHTTLFNCDLMWETDRKSIKQ